MAHWCTCASVHGVCSPTNLELEHSTGDAWVPKLRHGDGRTLTPRRHKAKHRVPGLRTARYSMVMVTARLRLLTDLLSATTMPRACAQAMFAENACATHVGIGHRAVIKPH
eukprot:355645-Chlamydomonas_euryale.AAC.30